MEFNFMVQTKCQIMLRWFGQNAKKIETDKMPTNQWHYVRWHFVRTQGGERRKLFGVQTQRVISFQQKGLFVH